MREEEEDKQLVTWRLFRKSGSCYCGPKRGFIADTPCDACGLYGLRIVQSRFPGLELRIRIVVQEEERTSFRAALVRAFVDVVGEG